jgi:hypothetical protein
MDNRLLVQTIGVILLSAIIGIWLDRSIENLDDD